MCLTLPAHVLSVEGTDAVVDARGARRTVSLAILALEGVEVRRGDWLLANAGVAVERIPEEDALRSIELSQEAEGDPG